MRNREAIIYKLSAGDKFRAITPSIPGCECDGKTLDEVLSKIRTCVKVCYNLMRDRKIVIPDEFSEEQIHEFLSKVNYYEVWYIVELYGL